MSLNPDLNALRDKIRRIESQQTRHRPPKKIFWLIVVVILLSIIIFQRERVTMQFEKLINWASGVEEVVIKGQGDVTLRPLPPQYLVVNNESINIRANASQEAKVISGEVQNSRLVYQNVYQKNGQTYWLKVKTSKGKVGWVSDSVVKWDRKSITLLKEDANNGNVAAMKEFGRRFSKGIGLHADPQNAFRWNKKAANAGDNVSQYLVGWYYQRGIGTVKNNELALAYYRLSALQENAAAMNSVGSFYADGIGIEANGKQARLWFEKAIEYGSLEALENLAELKGKLSR